MHAQRQPKARRNACQADDYRVHVHAVVDRARAELVRQHCAVGAHRHLAHGRRDARMSRLELFEAVKQLREPDHQRVVAGRQSELDRTGENGVAQVRRLAQQFSLRPDLRQQPLHFARLAHA